MSRGNKSHFYNELKNKGYIFDKHYRSYTADELEDILLQQGYSEITPNDYAVALDLETEAPTKTSVEQEVVEQPNMVVPPKERNPEELAGERLNTQPEDEPIRIDEQGLIWYQEEVRKPAYPKPRGRRILKYMDTGVRKETVQSGDYVETIEVAGNEQARPSEVKITLPSYQVGIYRDPRFPFKIHIYNEMRGFDYFEVQEFYGGEELVPPGVKYLYVENVLCYDMKSVIQAIQQEYRALQLAGKVD